MSSLEHLQNGRYAVLKKLGEGGKGVVYKTRDTVLNRVVAIKMLKSAVTSEEAYARFMREAQAVGKLNHPNIVSIHDIGKEGDKEKAYSLLNQALEIYQKTDAEKIIAKKKLLTA